MRIQRDFATIRDWMDMDRDRQTGRQACRHIHNSHTHYFIYI